MTQSVDAEEDYDIDLTQQPDYPEPIPVMTPSDPGYWQAMIDAGTLPVALAAISHTILTSVHWDEIETSGSMNFLKKKEVL